MSTSKKLKSEQLFVRVETVMHDLQISRPFAYRMIAGWNEELKEICQQTVKKLEYMTDDEFEAIDFTIYDEEELDGEM